MTQYKVVESLENLPNPTKHLCWSRLFDNITLNISTFYLYLHVNQESGLRNIPVTELYECVFVMEWWLMAGMLPPPPIRAFQAQVWTARQLWPVQDNQPGSQALAENTSPPTDSLPWCWRWQPSAFCQVCLRLRCKLVLQPPSDLHQQVGGSFSGARGAAGGYFLALESSACSAWSESNSQKQETGRREQSFQVTVWALTLHQYGNICLLSVWCLQFSLWKGEGKVVQCFVTSKLIILITKNIYLFITCMTLEISEWEDFILNQNRLLNKADCGECLSWKMFGEQGQACGDSQPCPWLLTPHRRAARHITWGAETKLYFTF